MTLGPKFVVSCVCVWLANKHTASKQADRPTYSQTDRQALVMSATWTQEMQADNWQTSDWTKLDQLEWISNIENRQAPKFHDQISLILNLFMNERTRLSHLFNICHKLFMAFTGQLHWKANSGAPAIVEFGLLTDETRWDEKMRTHKWACSIIRSNL